MRLSDAVVEATYIIDQELPLESVIHLFQYHALSMFSYKDVEREISELEKEYQEYNGSSLTIKQYLEENNLKLDPHYWDEAEEPI